MVARRTYYTYVLEQIFLLLLDSPADLARACAASPTFRRVITDPYFLRRFHAIHPPAATTPRHRRLRRLPPSRAAASFRRRGP
jgi:hypothetical protein